MNKKKEIILVKELEYNQLLSYLEQENLKGKTLKQGIKDIYLFYKDMQEKDFRIRSMIVKLRKEIELPLDMNKHESRKFKFTPNSHGNRKSRRRQDHKPDEDTTFLVYNRKLRMRAYLSLDPDNEEDVKIFSKYLEIRKSLKGREKRAFGRYVTNVSSKPLTLEGIDEALAEIKETIQ